MKTNIAGLEIIGDLHKCNKKLLHGLTSEILKSKSSLLIQEYGFTQLGSFYHQFDIGVTGVIALAESHIAFHTWPEEGYVSLNVFICNYSSDNTAKTKKLFNDLVDIFRPKSLEKQEITRKFTK